MANLLVTGGAGFIGSHFVDHWLAAHAGTRVVVLDALTYAGDERNLEAQRAEPRFRFVRGDIRDREQVEALLREEHIDTLVNFAAESHVDRSIAAPDAFVTSNIVGTYCLLEAARRVWLGDGARRRHRFHHVSTDEVYGSAPPGAPPADERSAYAPGSPYAGSKAAADQLVRAWGHTYGLEITISSSGNNYGPRQLPEKLIPLAVLHVLWGRPIPLYGDGAHQRDWLHVSDHCRGIEQVLLRGQPGQTYHLGGGTTRENRALLQSLCAHLDARFVGDASLAVRFPDSPCARGVPAQSLIQPVADRPGHDRRYRVSGSRAERELGHVARMELEQGLRDTIDWYLEHADRWPRRD